MGGSSAGNSGTVGVSGWVVRDCRCFSTGGSSAGSSGTVGVSAGNSRNCRYTGFYLAKYQVHSTLGTAGSSPLGAPFFYLQGHRCFSLGDSGTRLDRRWCQSIIPSEYLDPSKFHRNMNGTVTFPFKVINI